MSAEWEEGVFTKWLREGLAYPQLLDYGALTTKEREAFDFLGLTYTLHRDTLPILPFMDNKKG